MIQEHKGVAFGPVHELGVASRDVPAFYEATWPRRIALSLPDFYDWQFVAPPESGGKDWNCVAVRDGEILGVMGLNHRSFWLDGERRPACELTTWVVSEKARGLGVGRGIMAVLQASYGLMMGMGISNAAMQIYASAGFRYLSRIPRYFRILDLEAVRPHAKSEPLGERLIEAWRPATPPKYSAEQASPSDLAACEASMTDRANFFVRDAANLDWRYARHPIYRYETFVVRGQGSGAAVALRQDDAAGIRGLHVVDCFGDPRDLAAAVAFVDEEARARGAAFVDFYCSAGAIARHFLAAGWFSTSDDYFFQLSHLFYPPEFRTPQTTSFVVWAKDNMSALLDFGRLYVTKEDLDLDRPTLAYYEAIGRLAADETDRS